MIIINKYCGLDVHKDSVFACILDAQGKKNYGTTFFKNEVMG
jgi:hypothetical protein